MAGRPGRIPAQLVSHTLFYFTQEGDLKVYYDRSGEGEGQILSSLPQLYFL